MQDCGTCYCTVAKDMMGYEVFGQLPDYIQFDSLHEGDGIACILQQNSACWHKMCRDRFNATKLNWLHKDKVALCNENEAVDFAANMVERR